MKAVFSLVSLLIALAVVGVLAARMLKEAPSPSFPLSTSAMPGAPTGTPTEQGRQLQDKARTDLNKAVDEANAARDKAVEELAR
jgi:multidrug efflux pump subunit AcrB